MCAKKTEAAKKGLRELLDEFSAIVAWFDGDDLDVEQATQKYAEGAKLADEIERRLTEEKNKITVIRQKFSADASDTNDASADDSELDDASTSASEA